MNEKETIQFYNNESSSYSIKRYADIPGSYYQYLFMQRLALCLSFLREIEPSLPKEATLLEIGCADGVVMKAVEREFPGRFSALVGTDIAPDMLRQAENLNNNPRASFILRDRLPISEYDIVIELGVRVPDISSELMYALEHLKFGGYFFYSLDGKNSLHAKFKHKDMPYAEDFQTYRSYERIISTHFAIKDSRPYAFFVPKLWAFLSVARAVQPSIDRYFGKIIPELFHEKIYLLKKQK